MPEKNDCQKSKLFWICFGLLILAACILHYHTLDFQRFLSPGDHGRDLYAAAQTLDGKTPYRDYWWVYGPLMPYYYAIFFKWLGIAIPSLLFGKFLLTIAAIIFFFCALCQIVSPLGALLGALWFAAFQQDFFFTYNHAGGIAVLMALTYGLFRYFKNQQASILPLLSIGCGLLLLIKINFGVIAWAICLFSIWSADKYYQIQSTKAKTTFYLILGLGVPFVVGMIYFLLLHDQPLYYIRQCFPYISSDRPFHIPLLEGVKMLYWTYLKVITSNSFMAVLTLITALGVIKIGKDIITSRDVKSHLPFLLSLGCAFLFYGLNMHEFISSGVGYRQYWADPFLMMAIALILAYSIETLRNLFRVTFFITVLIFIVFTQKQLFAYNALVKTPANYLDLPRSKVYISNGSSWIGTARETVDFINKNLRSDEHFFALPYDCVYYYLSNRPSPTEMLIFFDHINIPPEQETKIILQLEEKNVNWVLVSNRSVSFEEGNGILGKTYCPKLGKYIEDNFEIAAQFGDWKNPSGWAWNHGTRLLKRK